MQPERDDPADGVELFPGAHLVAARQRDGVGRRQQLRLDHLELHRHRLQITR